MGNLFAYIRGIPSRPEINIRSGPNKNYPLIFTAAVGTTNLIVLDAKADEQNDGFQGKVYTWLKLQFPGGQTGWGRDDLLDIFGDGSAFGYGQIAVQTFAFPLRRQNVVAPVVPSVTPATPSAPAAPTPASVSATSLSMTTVTASPAPAPAPAVPASPVTPAPAPAPVPAPVTPAPAVPTGAAVAIVKTQGAANTRSGPSTTFERTGVTLDRHSRWPILAVQPEQIGQKYRWFKLDAKGRQLWVREDLVSYDGDSTALGLPKDLYPAPMKEQYWWVRGYNMPPFKDEGLVDHDGWDLGAANGEPMLAGPKGGLVVKSLQCQKCTADRPSTLMQGFSLGDSRIYTDEGWGNGYGNYIIVRYSSEQLPQSTRDLLVTRGFPGGAIFVMYGHLASRMVEQGMTLSGGQQIGTCGNTGNSEAPHLHLEIRASKDQNFSQWYNIRNGVMDPVALFKR